MTLSQVAEISFLPGGVNFGVWHLTRHVKKVEILYCKVGADYPQILKDLHISGELACGGRESDVLFCFSCTLILIFLLIFLKTLSFYCQLSKSRWQELWVDTNVNMPSVKFIKQVQSSEWFPIDFSALGFAFQARYAVSDLIAGCLWRRLQCVQCL